MARKSTNQPKFKSKTVKKPGKKASARQHGKAKTPARSAKKSKSPATTPPKRRAPTHDRAPPPRDGFARIELRNMRFGTMAIFDVKLVDGRCRNGVEYFGEFDGAPCALSSGGALNFGWGERDRRRLVTDLLQREIIVGATIAFADQNDDDLTDCDVEARRFQIVAIHAWPAGEGRELVRVGALALDDDRSGDPQHRLRFDAIMEHGQFKPVDKRYGVWVDEGYVNPFSIDRTGAVDFGPLYESDDRVYRTNLMKGVECRPASEICWEAVDDPENADWVFRIDRVTQI